MNNSIRIIKNVIKPFNHLVNLLKKIPLPLILLFLMIPLRLINLGYSEYICDESVALSWLKNTGKFYSTDFLLSQHKGPVQYLIAGMIFLLSRDIFTEVIYRIPFAFANCFAIVVFYLFVRNVTKNKYSALISTFLFGVNGLILVFGRVFQYQSLNLLFSSLSLYFYSNISLRKNENGYGIEKSIIKNSVAGTIFFCLSLLSHWDAVFILPYVGFVIFKDVLFKKDLSRVFKKKFVSINLLIILILSVLYLFPYIKYFINSSENQSYFQGRVRPSSINKRSIISMVNFITFRMRLYNPLLFLELNIGILLLSFFSINKNWFYIFWFFLELLIFTFIFTSPGTHIYNLLLPLTINASIFIDYLFKHVSNIKIPSRSLIITSLLLLTITTLAFFYYQSYVLFVDHNPEYPWRAKAILNMEVGKFSSAEKAKYLVNNKIGFPLRREWLKIENSLANYEREKGIAVGSTPIQSNENYCPVVFYTGRTLSDSGKRFIVAIKYPLSFVNDYKRFSGVKEKDLIETITGEHGQVCGYNYITR